MKTHTLQGNLLSFFVGLALNLHKEPDGAFYAPWDYWEGDIHYRGQSFLPFGETPHQETLTLGQLYPHIKRLRIQCRPHGDSDYWQVGFVQGMNFGVRNPLHGYALAIVWATFGEDVPDYYDCPHFKKRIYLPPFNVPFGEPAPELPAKVLTAAACSFEPGPSTSYRDALEEARRMKEAGESAGYQCDGHSWVLAQFHDGSSKYLFNGTSTIGLPPL